MKSRDIRIMPKKKARPGDAGKASNGAAAAPCSARSSQRLTFHFASAKAGLPPRCRPCRCCWWVRLIQVGLATLLHRPQLQHTHREQLSCQLDERNPQSALLPPRSGGDVAPTVSLEGRQACVRYHLHALRVSRQAFVTGGGGRASGGAQNMHG